MSKRDKIEIPDQVGNENRGEIVLYQPEGEVRLEVRVENETVWLTQAQMAELFDVQRQAITKHIRNIFDSHELEEPSTSSILELVQKEGRRVVKRPVTLYNLDMIISVGFRVNTQRGIKFRRWANQVLKEYMLKGYAINHILIQNSPTIHLTHSEFIIFSPKRGFLCLSRPTFCDCWPGS